MATYYKIYNRIFKTREEVARLLTDSWNKTLKEYKIGKTLSDELSKIEEFVIDAELIHNEHGRSIWSDGKIRFLSVREICEEYDMLHDIPTKIEDSPVSFKASNFVSTVMDSDGGTIPAWLGRIRDVLEKKEIQIGNYNGGFSPRKIEKIRLRLDTEDKTVFVFSVGYSEGYQFDVFDRWEQAKEAFNPPPCPLTECMECGEVFDVPGRVEWGGMGCARCNR